MTTKVGIAETDLTASQQKEFWRLASLSGGSHVNRHTFQLYLEGKNPFAFERNEHGHIILTFVGINRLGAEESALLTSDGYNVGTYAHQCFTSTKADSYDAKHRLVDGREYKIALMPGIEIPKDSDRTTENLRKRGMELYGYGKPLAGHIPSIRRTVSDKQMEEMLFWYIVSLHDPIEDADGDPRVLGARRSGAGRRVDADRDRPGDQWSGGGCFAFPVSQVSP